MPEINPARARADPAYFIEAALADPETGSSYKLLPAEKAFLEHAFKTRPDGRLLYSEQVYGCPKKSGKTAFAAMHALTTTLLFSGRYAETILVANSLDQSVGRVFECVRKIVECSPWLRRQARITADKIAFQSIGGSIRAIPSDYASAAGSNQNLAVFDELWAYTSERAHRLWDELVPPPTRKVACRLTVTYAGFWAESALLEGLYKRGMTQPEVGKDLRAGDGMLMFWSHDPVAPWQDENWLADMRRSLRPNQYLRMIENRFVATESSFIDMASWDACVVPSLTPSMERQPVYIGVDASVKRDSTAIAAVSYDRKTSCVRLVAHRVFTPTPGDPIDFEATVEATLLDWRKRYLVRSVWFDPYQMAASSQRLAKAHIAMAEFAQTIPNLTAATSNLFELIQARTLVLYPDAGMRLAVSRAVVTESSRGWKLDKLKQAHKIDVIVALSMACLAAVRSSGEPVYDLFACFPDNEEEELASQPVGEPSRGERAHAELMRKYGAPVSLNSLPPEHVVQARGRDLLPFQLEAIARARADSLRRRNEPPSEGESHGS
jgi:Terminase large subunit, ATPase domain